ncbi:MAG: hypothetical protein J6W10_05645 [Kiritimatiellae bacterium]|nr:hypothetical protein [Kiritimatiellia bacterium]
MNTYQFIDLALRICSESDKTRPALHSFFRYDGHLIATDGRIALVVALNDKTVEPAIDSQESIGASLLCDILPKLDRKIEDGKYKPFDLNLANSAAAASMGDLIYDASCLMSNDEEDEEDEPNTLRDICQMYAAVILGPARSLVASYYVSLLCRLMNGYDYGSAKVFASPDNPHATIYAKGDNWRFAIQPRRINPRSQSPFDFLFSGCAIGDDLTVTLVHPRSFGVFNLEDLRHPEVSHD